MIKSKELLFEPWQLSVEEKRKIFEEAKREGRKIALYYVKGPDALTFRYRCFNVFQATLESKKWQAIYFFSYEMEVLEDLIPQCDLVVLGRQTQWENLVKKIVDLARAAKKMILLDIDDLIFDKKYLYILANTVSNLSNLNYWIAHFESTRKTANQCDGFLVTNDYLGERISRSFDKPYQVIRNSLNREQVVASEAYLGLKEKMKKTDFTIGYFGGSPTHVNDLDVIWPELLAFLENYPEVKLKIVGYMDFDKRVKPFLRSGRIQFVPFVDFRKLQYYMSVVDINIAPLVINVFTNCKSELKFFEAGVVETTTIASPTYAFAKTIDDGKNGFLAWPGEWYDKLEYLYQNPEENRKVAKKAREYALKHYYGKELIKEIENAYDKFVQDEVR